MSAIGLESLVDRMPIIINPLQLSQLIRYLFVFSGHMIY